MTRMGPIVALLPIPLLASPLGRNFSTSSANSRLTPLASLLSPHASRSCIVGSHMEQLPDQTTPQRSTQAPPVHVIHISAQPRTWLGKLLATIVALTLVVVGFFVSIVVFAAAACVAAVAILYFFWATRRARRATRDDVIDGEVKSRDIH